MQNLLERNLEKSYGFNEGALPIVAGVMGLAVAIIVAVGVALPITVDVVNTANVTGIAATIVGYLPVFVALIPLMVIVSSFF